MGLEEREKSLFVKVPESSKPHPVRSGLHSVDNPSLRFSRRTGLRTALDGIAALGTAGIPGIAFAETYHSPSEQLVLDKTSMFIEAAKKFSLDDIGQRMTTAYKRADIDDGMFYMGFEGATLQDHPTLGVVLWNNTDELHKKGLDPEMQTFYQIPPKEDFDDHASNLETAFNIRADHFRVDADILSWIKQKRLSFETGVITSQQKDYGPFSVVRLQRYAVQKWTDGPYKGLIQRILTGKIVANVGRTIDNKTIPGDKIIPDEALIDTVAETRGFRLNESTPGGTLEINNFTEGLAGFKLNNPESSAQLDELFKQLNVKVKFVPNPLLKSGIGTYILKSCETCTKTPETYAVLKGSVDPVDPRTLIMEFNFLRPDYKLDSAYLKTLSKRTAGSIASGLSIIIYGMDVLELSNRGTPEQNNYIGQLSARLQDLNLIELIAPTTG